MTHAETVVKEFATEYMMAAWLADSANLDRLKADYPPSEYTARLEMIERKVIVSKKEPA